MEQRASAGTGSGRSRGTGVAGRIARAVGTIFPLLLAGTAYGYAAHREGWFPSAFFKEAEVGYHAILQTLGRELPFHLTAVGDVPRVKTYQPGKMAPGLTLVAGFSPVNKSRARVIDASGKVVQHWDLDWFRIFPNQDHLPESKQFISLSS